MAEWIHFLNTGFQYVGHKEVCEAIRHASRVRRIRVATLNPEFMLEARHNEPFREAIGKMTHCVIDGSGLLGVLRLFRKKLGIASSLELYHGADLAEDLFQEFKDGERSFFLLGGPDGLAEDTAASLRGRYPHIAIAGAESGGFIDADNPVKSDLLERVNAADPDILLIGFGAPKQELWMIGAGEALKAPVAIGLGGTFGFYTNKKRAPLAFRRLHMEWLWRSITEVGHFRRAWRAVVVFPWVSLLAHFGPPTD
jgi:N-acetylglucosaminyldiphosphoundecaprenol N-acetyl-beta-D-mannosaminyltransferase